MPPAGIEPASQPPQGCALSGELRGQTTILHFSGEAGIRTLGGGFSPLNRLAGGSVRPLRHLPEPTITTIETGTIGGGRGIRTPGDLRHNGFPYHTRFHRPINVVVWTISSPSQVPCVWSLRILETSSQGEDLARLEISSFLLVTHCSIRRDCHPGGTRGFRAFQHTARFTLPVHLRVKARLFKTVAIVHSAIPPRG